MWNSKTVSVVFPAYNEEPNIKSAIEEFWSITNTDGSRIVDEIITVDNNSQDQTGKIAKSAGAAVYLETKQGYGNALMRGLDEADSDLVVLCEPDGTFVAADIIKLLAYAGDFEMVCGTRTYPGLVWEDANMPWYLRLGNYGVAKILEILYWTPSLSDCGCTFRVIQREAVSNYGVGYSSVNRIFCLTWSSQPDLAELNLSRFRFPTAAEWAPPKLPAISPAW